MISAPIGWALDPRWLQSIKSPPGSFEKVGINTVGRRHKSDRSNYQLRGKIINESVWNSSYLYYKAASHEAFAWSEYTKAPASTQQRCHDICLRAEEHNKYPLQGQPNSIEGRLKEEHCVSLKLPWIALFTWLWPVAKVFWCDRIL